ncbi:MAG: class I SAM-dependent methyltransferase [Lachnospiraceae bacterium]|nr:class I SAM-dependent methyltransferase [Lachnospiraceae bacterium]
MKKILIWGAGGMALGLSRCFDKNAAEITGYIDIDEGKKKENILGESRIMTPEKIPELEYDFIFISSIVHQREIFEYMISIGVEREKIVSAAITDNELGRVFDLFTEKGMAYILHITNNSRINRKLDKINEKLTDIAGKLDNIYRENRKRYTNLFLKNYYEEKAARFIAENFIESGDAPGKNAIFEERNLYYDYVLGNIRYKEGLYLEFGVYKGSSINYIADRIGGRIIYGFDSFEGLPEGWLPGYQKGKFNENGELPAVKENVRLVKGWFDETLPDFIKAHKSEQCSFIHIDCDLYSSTKCVLSLLRDNIGRGTIICFDELAGQIGWQDDEYRALMEFSEEAGLRFKYLACAFGGGHQLTERVAIEIL